MKSKLAIWGVIFLLAGALLQEVAAEPSDWTRSIKEVSVEGLRWTNPDYIRRVVGLKPGDLIDDSLLPGLKQKIENKGRFRNISLKIEPVSEEEAILSIRCEDQFPFFGYPWGDYNSYSGLTGSLSFSNSNLSGNLDTLSLSVNFGWNPAVPNLADSITAYSFSAGYNFNNMPGIEKLSFSSSAYVGMFSSRRVDVAQVMTYRRDTYSVSGVVSVSYPIVPGFTASTGLALRRNWNDLRISDPNIPSPDDVFTLSPSLSFSFNRMNYLDMGAERYGWSFGVSESPAYNFMSKSFTNGLSITALAGCMPLPFVNCLIRASYSNRINDKNAIGGYYSYLRGFQNSEVTTDNALILNNENRFKIFDDFLWGRVSVAFFEDVCWSFDSFDFTSSKLLAGAGIGIRYRSNILGMTFKGDIAWNLEDLSQFPEIVFTIGELIQ